MEDENQIIIRGRTRRTLLGWVAIVQVKYHDLKMSKKSKAFSSESQAEKALDGIIKDFEAKVGMKVKPL